MSKFALGRVVATPGALKELEERGVHPLSLLGRHVSGDWGDLDNEDKVTNELALVNGARILSAYNLVNGTRLWIITEAKDEFGQRNSTTLLLPSEY